MESVYEVFEVGVSIVYVYVCNVDEIFFLDFEKFVWLKEGFEVYCLEMII